MPRLLLCLPILSILLSLTHGANPVAAPAKKIDFVRDIQPIFKRSCISCHNAGKARAGVRLDDGTHALKGGNGGAFIKPGDSAKSRLIALVAGTDKELRMPQDKTKALSSSEIALLRAWIDQGAAWPRAATTVTKIDASKHWAFQPIKRYPLPRVTKTDWARTPLDTFVLARLEKEKIAPSPQADRVVLIRRLYLDLLGLPPSPEQVDAYLADKRPGAYERLVDRILASPHYGERWGRHWLDAARYADSDGFEKDTGRPFAWRFRHWVIAALNSDLSYDQFTIEQLAGDLLPKATTEQKVATGFHRNTLTNNEGGVDKEQFRVEAVVDRVNTTARVWLGLTLGCAQCHDHKYDPLSQREYYQFFAFFNSDVEVNIPAPALGWNLAGGVLKPAQQKKVNALIAKLKAYRQKQLPAKVKVWERSLTAPTLQSLPPKIVAILKTPVAKRTAAQKQALTAFYESKDGELVQLQRNIIALQTTGGGPTMAQTLALGKKRKTNIMIRGDFLRPGVEVSAGTPAILNNTVTGSSATRLELAKWLVDPKNPLTSRVAVNWVWQRFFGRGLVNTPEDFGTQGEKPSHPELLDWLATEFMEQGWSLKKLHRLIVTSAVYRQSSNVRTELASKDPYNTLLARQSRQRLEAEIIRDVTLASSGLLFPAIGGPSVRPPQPSGISELTYAGSARWAESKGLDRYRRGLYTWFQRTSPYPMLMTFDAPDSNVCTVKRDKSNTPLQALTLLNDVVFVECARAMGLRVLASGHKDVKGRLTYAFRLAVSRTPTATELTRLTKLHDEVKALCDEDAVGAAKLVGAVPVGLKATEAATWLVIARTLLNLDEVVTRE